MVRQGTVSLRGHAFRDAIFMIRSDSVTMCRGASTIESVMRRGTARSAYTSQTEPFLPHHDITKQLPVDEALHIALHLTSRH